MIEPIADKLIGNSPASKEAAWQDRLRAEGFAPPVWDSPG
jgi:hypothetical protein